MSQQGVEQIRFDFLPRLPIEIEARRVQVSSDAGILPIRQFDDQSARLAKPGVWRPRYR